MDDFIYGMMTGKARRLLYETVKALPRGGVSLWPVLDYADKHPKCYGFKVGCNFQGWGRPPVSGVCYVEFWFGSDNYFNIAWDMDGVGDLGTAYGDGQRTDGESTYEVRIGREDLDKKRTLHWGGSTGDDSDGTYMKPPEILAKLKDVLAKLDERKEG